MSHLVIFPWIDREEIRHIYGELFSYSVSKQKHAVDRLTVWRSRAMNRLPSAVESTAAFINAEIASKSHSVKSVDDHRLRSLYSMALIRFINHITEKGQQGAYAVPVHVVAAEVGVPEWIVELRHEATHGSLPSLNELKAAASWALYWLREKFWEPQTQDTFLVSALRSAALDMLKDSLVSYMQRKFNELSDGREISCRQTLSNIEHVLGQLGRSACPVLVEDGYFIFTEEQLRSHGYSSTDLATDGSMLLPDKLIDFWRKVIDLLVKTNLIEELVLHIASVITELPSLRNTLLCNWLYTLVWYNKGNRREKQQNGLYQSYIDMPYKYLIEKCLNFRSCNRNCDALLNLLVEKSHLNSDQKQDIKQLLSIYETPDMNYELPLKKIVQSVSDFPNREAARQTWRRCTEPVTWSRIPVGVLPNQMLDFRSLDLDTDSDADLWRYSDNLSEQMCAEQVNGTYSDTNERTESGDGNGEELGDAVVKTFHCSSTFQWDDTVKRSIAEHIQLLVPYR